MAGGDDEVIDAADLTARLEAVLPRSPAGGRAAWVWRRVGEMAGGAPPPSRDELEAQYTARWLDDVPMGPVLEWLAGAAPDIVDVHVEPSRSDEARFVAGFADGSAHRFRCVVEATAPHRIVLQIFAPAMPPSTYEDRVVERDGRRVAIRDFGGDGPLLLLWHGSGVDLTSNESVVPHLRGFRVVAHDLPGHGGSTLARLTTADAVADADAVVADLGLGPPIVAGFSLGGWMALHYAARRPSRGLVCLDGPTCLDYAEMGVREGHPGFVPDPPDVVTDVAALRCPAIVVLCRGATPEESEWMVPFRTGLADHLAGIAAAPAPIHVEWLDTGHMLNLSVPKETAAIVNRLAGQRSEGPGPNVG